MTLLRATAMPAGTIDVSIDEARNKAFFQLNTKGGAKLIEMVANG